MISQISFLIYSLLNSFHTFEISLCNIMKVTFSSISYTILKQMEVSIIQIPVPSLQDILVNEPMLTYIGRGPLHYGAVN